MLEILDLGNTLSKQDYKRRLPTLQDRAFLLQRACWNGQLGSLIVFEGWDAAGKGEKINKLTQRLEPRGFSLYAVQGPRTYERHLPWLWRFWNMVPNHAEMAIFDQSWYRRVLRERVEGRVEKRQWRTAYRDINGFERALADDRYVVVKFFLHISKEEQAKRLKELGSDEATAWQVGPDDWSRHEKYDQYLEASEEMLERTESEWAPWHIVDATDLRWSRVRIFEAIIERLTEGLRTRDLPLPDESELSEMQDDQEMDG